MTDVQSFKFVVVGSGFSGAVSAERIANVLKENVLLIEKRAHIGGNAYDFKKGGITVQKYGPHIFHTNYDDVFHYLSHFTEWIPYKHRVLAYIDGKFVPLPFNFTSLEKLFPTERAKKLESLLTAEFGAGKRVSILELMHSKNTEAKELAEFIYQKVFVNYTVKQWGIPPEKIDKTVISRVPVNLSYEDTYFSDKFQGIPRPSFSALFEKMLKNKRIHIMLNTDFKELFDIDIANKRILLKNGKEFFGRVIYTGRTDELFNFIYGKLEYRSLKFVYEKHDTEFYQKVAVVNYPNNYDFTRITEFKHFYAERSKNTIIAKEFPKRFTESDEPYYPILSARNKELYEKYRALAAGFKNLTLLGRLANYKYINMDQAVFNALNNFKKIL